MSIVHRPRNQVILLHANIPVLLHTNVPVLLHANVPVLLHNKSAQNVITKIAGAVIPEGASAAGEVGKVVSGRVTASHARMLSPAMHTRPGSLRNLPKATADLKELAVAPAAEQRMPMTPINLGDRSRSVQRLLRCRTCLGSLSNVLLMPFINEATGVATRDDIDKTLRLGMAHPTGCYNWQRLYKGTSDSKHRPSVLLERMADAQYLEKKNYHLLYMAWLTTAPATAKAGDKLKLRQHYSRSWIRNKCIGGINPTKIHRQTVCWYPPTHYRRKRGVITAGLPLKTQSKQEQSNAINHAIGQRGNDSKQTALLQKIGVFLRINLIAWCNATSAHV
ncbi:hypothetical protein DEU56DRAFT_760268 [Suillus clintonianus]|uniref:uncharacterized protein n=1 Tax=Suillus clintonianus TaxID=1904413 RepID=UPI001B87892E|nr:uncharacterized protein DEU56DRAFT_760268 [Suillus clintonianus]KAG2122740.1 hypothetical protein DEU56DRAFT_760268 [Suillus clintonianus]